MINTAAHSDPSIKAYLASYKTEDSAFSRFVNAGNQKASADFSSLRAAAMHAANKQPMSLNLPDPANFSSELKVWLGCNHRSLTKKERCLLIAKLTAYSGGTMLFAASVVSFLSMFMAH